MSKMYRVVAGVDSSIEPKAAVKTAKNRPAGGRRDVRRRGNSVDALAASENAAMREVLERARKVARSPSTAVLLRGESGTGKKMLARLIHQDTPGRSAQRFVELHCTAITEELFDSMVFGCSPRPTERAGSGLLARAASGTLFLNEVGELGPALQTKLIRALDSMTVHRVEGALAPLAEVRVISATSHLLEDDIAQGRFRLDLFHRLDVFRITIPPLRDRREDILALSRFLLNGIARRLGRRSLPLSRETEQLLLSHDYPGNVRELRNVLERALILESGHEITPSSVLLGAAGRLGAEETRTFFSATLTDDGRPPSLAELEKQYVARLLSHTRGNRAEVARLLKVSYPTVAKKIADYGIKVLN